MHTQSINQFLKRYFNSGNFQLSALGGDASFRRYSRVIFQGQSTILVESDPQKINNLAFEQLNSVFKQQGLVLPDILAAHSDEGLYLLSDLGQVHLADLLSEPNRLEKYKQVINLLPAVAQCKGAPELNVYDRAFMEMELSLFQEWCVEKFLNERLSLHQSEQLAGCYKILVENMQNQPQVGMHRDFHSRNIMWSNQRWALIDYQDAVTGPLSYDLASLLKDCYFELPKDEQQQLLEYGFQRLSSFMDATKTFIEFKRDVDFVGLQRHIKVVGIFCRLWLRDGKPAYLRDLPLTIKYIIESAEQYPELTFLASFFRQEVSSKVMAKLEALQ